VPRTFERPDATGPSLPILATVSERRPARQRKQGGQAGAGGVLYLGGLGVVCAALSIVFAIEGAWIWMIPGVIGVVSAVLGIRSERRKQVRRRRPRPASTPDDLAG